jgi:hypothetical protein
VNPPDVKDAAPAAKRLGGAGSDGGVKVEAAADQVNDVQPERGAQPLERLPWRWTERIHDNELVAELRQGYCGSASSVRGTGVAGRVSGGRGRLVKSKEATGDFL